jgi:mono/diheme cytochrome c family protein
VSGIGRLLCKPWAAWLLVVVLVGAGAATAIARHIPDPGLSLVLANRTPDPVRGLYLATVGDCAACHTAAGGKPLAGGRPFNTPVGVIYSTNITSNPEHGIGRYSLEDFARLLRQGVRPDGGRIYPAMPYTAFAKVSDEDLQDLYAWMKSTVPAATANRSGSAIWPLSLRWPLALWNLAFHQDRRFVADPTRSADWNRGAYLVQGLGHCGTCHTPRGLAFQEKDLDGRTGLFLSGARLDGASPINLRANPGDGLGRWSQAEIVELLSTGRSLHSSVVGPMGEVVAASTQHMTAADLAAIATYLKSLSPAPGGGHATFVASGATLNEVMAGRQTAPGGRMFMDSCAACHRLSGSGEGRTLPSLAGNSTVLAQYPDTLVNLILVGARAPGTARAPSRTAMPPFGWRYGDKEVAELATYVRQSWGNQAPAVTTGQVRAIRIGLDMAESRR